MAVEIVTFGCRLNAAESDAMREAAEAAGHRDATVVNTCAVTSEAVRQGRKAVIRAARDRPGTPIVVTGCASQVARDRFAGLPGVSAILENGRKAESATWRDLRLPAAPAALAPLRTETENGRTRGLVPVQTGCDHRCTFCIIPFGRGPSRSVPSAEAVRHVRRLVAGGAREVVLTGVDMTGWGADLSGTPRLGMLVRDILREVPDLPRLRLSSIDSVEADDDLLRALAEEARLMPHLHLSLQAGDDLVLKRMKRRHSRADAIAFCRAVRRLRPDTVFGADLIAGFPTETEEMFRRSLDLVAECGLTHLHVFPFSARPGTPAARMPAVPAPAVKERAARLRAAGNAAFRRHLESEVGRTLSVLTERGGIGRAESYTAVRFARAVPAGEIRPVRIAGHDGRHLLAA